MILGRTLTFPSVECPLRYLAEHSHSLQWSALYDTWQNTHIPFSGVPFMILGRTLTFPSVGVPFMILGRTLTFPSMGCPLWYLAEHSHSLQWGALHDTWQNTHIPFSGVPFMILGRTLTFPSVGCPLWYLAQKFWFASMDQMIISIKRWHIKRKLK